MALTLLIFELGDSDGKTVLKALINGHFVLTVHASSRMQERSITKADIRECGRTCRSCVRQRHKNSFRVNGCDRDGDDLTVICGIDQGVVVVTVY